MQPEKPEVPEIESFNLAELDVSGLDARLELTAIVPQFIVCDQNCPENTIGCTVDCGVNSGCTCNSFDT
jgi:hypothetical protein